MTVSEKEFSLSNYITENQHSIAEFEAGVQYFRDGDHLTVFFSDESCKAERVDDLLTIYVSDHGDDLIGCKIKGITRLVKNSSIAFDIQREEVSLQMLLASAIGDADVEEKVYSLGKRLKNFPLTEIIKEVEQQNDNSNHPSLSV